MDKLINNKNSIIITTKDKPRTLEKTLDSICNVRFPKYIIDDSVVAISKVKNRQLICKYTNCFYLGINEYNAFVRKYQIDLQKYSFLLRPLGNKKWNLGYVRNFALLTAKAIESENVLFMDDDITVPEVESIDTLFRLMDSFAFVGAHISGLVDDSILGHIATNVGIENERMLSGGFMVYKPANIEQYFLNIYNEDWIWLFLQTKGKQILQTEEVYQEISNPIDHYKSKGKFQEYGEIALDGVMDLHQNGLFDLLIEVDFWERIVKERKEYLGFLLSKIEENGNTLYAEIVKWIGSNSKDFSAKQFQSLFKQYFENRETFLKLYQSL